MVALNFSILINASKEKVWRTLWDDASYREWTSVFGDGSYAVSEWKEGNKIQFISAEGDGMFSLIFKMVPNELMSFKHLGIVKNGVEQPEDEETKKWSGAMETYTMTEKETSTELSVTIDVTEDHEPFFRDTFPKALDRVKTLAEK